MGAKVDMLTRFCERVIVGTFKALCWKTCRLST